MDSGCIQCGRETFSTVALVFFFLFGRFLFCVYVDVYTVYVFQRPLVRVIRDSLAGVCLHHVINEAG